MSAAFTLMHEEPYAFMPSMPKQVGGDTQGAQGCSCPSCMCRAQSTHDWPLLHQLLLICLIRESQMSRGHPVTVAPPGVSRLAEGLSNSRLRTYVFLLLYQSYLILCSAEPCVVLCTAASPTFPCCCCRPRLSHPLQYPALLSQPFCCPTSPSAASPALLLPHQPSPAAAAGEGCAAQGRD